MHLTKTSNLASLNLDDLFQSVLNSFYMYLFYEFDLVLLCPCHMCFRTLCLQITQINSLRFHVY